MIIVYQEATPVVRSEYDHIPVLADGQPVTVEIGELMLRLTEDQTTALVAGLVAVTAPRADGSQAASTQGATA